MRLLEPAQVAAGDVQLVQPVGHVRVVVQDAAVLGLPCAPRPEQPTLRRGERSEDELRQRLRGLEQIRALETTARFRERRERQSVPRGDRLVVAERLCTALTFGEQARPCVGVDLAAKDETTMLEGMQLLPWNAVLLRPRVRQAFEAIGVGILRRSKAP